MGVTLKYGHDTQTATIPDDNFSGEMNIPTDRPGPDVGSLCPT